MFVRTGVSKFSYPDTGWACYDRGDILQTVVYSTTHYSCNRANQYSLIHAVKDPSEAIKMVPERVLEK